MKKSAHTFFNYKKLGKGDNIDQNVSKIALKCTKCMDIIEYLDVPNFGFLIYFCMFQEIVKINFLESQTFVYIYFFVFFFEMSNKLDRFFIYAVFIFWTDKHHFLHFWNNIFSQFFEIWKNIKNKISKKCKHFFFAIVEMKIDICI